MTHENAEEVTKKNSGVVYLISYFFNIFNYLSSLKDFRKGVGLFYRLFPLIHYGISLFIFYYNYAVMLYHQNEQN